jgi:xanthine dehydrogenase YagS FAD-binding subunit
MEGGTSLVREGDNRYHAIFGNDGPALFVSSSSLGPPLIALGAALKAEGPDGKARRIEAAQFFQTPKTDQERETVLKPNEILTEIEIPIQGLKNATYEVRHRHGLDWPYVTASVALPSRDQATTEARVVLGHVAPVPWIAREAGQILRGAPLSETLAAQCGEAAAKGAAPLSRNAYKVQLVKVAVKRALLAAAKA